MASSSNDAPTSGHLTTGDEVFSGDLIGNNFCSYGIVQLSYGIVAIVVQLRFFCCLNCFEIVYLDCSVKNCNWLMRMNLVYALNLILH